MTFHCFNTWSYWRHCLNNLKKNNLLLVSFVDTCLVKTPNFGQVVIDRIKVIFIFLCYYLKSIFYVYLEWSLTWYYSSRARVHRLPSPTAMPQLLRGPCTKPTLAESTHPEIIYVTFGKKRHILWMLLAKKCYNQKTQTQVFVYLGNVTITRFHKSII